MKMKTVALALAVSMLMSGTAMAAPLKVLVLGHENNTSLVQAELNDLIGSDARFDLANSAAYDATVSGLPTLAYLSQFSSILVSTNYSPDAFNLSNLLADYVDAGGGVVISTFWGQQVGTSGRLNTTGYNPLTNPTFGAYTSRTLGAYNAADPLMQGVTSLSSVYYNAEYTAGLDNGATLAASWDNGNPLAAYSANKKVAAITLYPNVAQYQHATGDYRQLFGNALALTAGAPSVAAVPEPATWAMMIGGCGMVGGSMRYRRRKTTVSFA